MSFNSSLSSSCVMGFRINKYFKCLTMAHILLCYSLGLRNLLIQFVESLRVYLKWISFCAYYISRFLWILAFPQNRIPAKYNKIFHLRSLICAKYQAKYYCVKTVRIQSYSGPYFSACGLNTERYSVPLRIHFKCGKMRTRITLNTDTFLKCIWRMKKVCKKLITMILMLRLVLFSLNNKMKQ